MAVDNHSDTRSVSSLRGVESTLLRSAPDRSDPLKAVARARRIIVGRARHDKRLNPGCYKLYCELDDRAGRNLETWVHQTSLARDVGASVRTIIRRLKMLEDCAYLRKRKTQTGNRYRLAMVDSFLGGAAEPAETVTSQVTKLASASLYANPVIEPNPSDRPTEPPARCAPRTAAAGLVTEGERDTIRRHLAMFEVMGVREEDGRPWDVEATAAELVAVGWKLGLAPFAVAAFLFRLYNRVQGKRSAWPERPRWFRSCLDREHTARCAPVTPPRPVPATEAAAIAGETGGEMAFTRELLGRAVAAVGTLR